MASHVDDCDSGNCYWNDGDVRFVREGLLNPSGETTPVDEGFFHVWTYQVPDDAFTYRWTMCDEHNNELLFALLERDNATL